MLSKKKLALAGGAAAVAICASAPMAMAVGDHDHTSGPDYSTTGPKQCDFAGGDSENNTFTTISPATDSITGKVDGTVRGNNTGNAGNCSEFANDNGKDNEVTFFDFS
ncbi:hypothetical protein [Pseudonocardia phyllosphaerae]|uniref:hypothetical protein n=1 Tax=Pseudonocardia phyllosphaerae TaxID=3390502 RepID=UPI00397AA5F3